MTTLTTEPITADDALTRHEVEEAHLPSLLAALAHVTGDLTLLRDDLKPDPSFLAGEQGGLSEEQQATARTLAFDRLRAYRDAGCPAPAPLTSEQLRQIMDFLTGAATDEYVPLLQEELGFPNEDGRAPRWRKEDLDADRAFTVAIIGGGMSGILAGIRLSQAGVPFVILEKNADLGGTWYENTYPGARVDSSNHFYSYSFAQRTDWPFHFSTQSVLLDYFQECAQRFGVRDQVRFQTEVLSATWDDDAAAWTLRLRRPDGGEDTLVAQAIISAVGQLNRPKLPDIPGRDDFAGPAFHSAQWDHSVDLTGKRVAVIGTGASASQFIPVVAEQAAELRVFQRTPNWYLPVPNYHDRVEGGLQWLLRHVPHYAQWYRFWLFWQITDGLLPAAKVDPAWQPRDRSVSAANDELRQLFTDYLEEHLGDDPDLLRQVVPDYPPASKRIVLDNGIWPATLKRENVQLITENIAAIEPDGVRTADGSLHAADVIIYGTGFHASRFLMPMRITGRDGRDLHEQWGGDARAYLGITIPHFPNLFCLYGPNTNIVVNGSIVWFSECEVTYILGCLRLLLAERHGSIEPKESVHDAYNARIDEGNLQMAWGVSKVNSWYKNEFGRVAQNWPFSMLEFWQQTREPQADDYVLR